jgi:hypothetical protein
MSQVAIAPPQTSVAPNVPGAIINGNHAFAVNNNYGTIIYRQAPEPVTLRAMSPRPPSQPANFVDRVTERAQLETSIRDNTPIVVYGPEGAGKSTLLRAAARSEAARALPNGMLRLEGVDAEGKLLPPGDVIQSLFDALYASTPPLKVDAALARTYLSRTRPLVILDNISLPTRDTLQTIIDLFPDSPTWFALPQLPLSTATATLKLGVLPREAARELLVKQSGLVEDDNNRALLDEVCEYLADVPLAIVLAANVIRDRAVPLDRVRQILEAAQPPSSDVVQAGLERAYALAYLTLSQEERQTLAAVAAAPGISVDPASVRAMLSAAAWVEPTIERLKVSGLLHANSPRLRLDPGLRSVALSTGNVALLRERLLAYLQNRLQTQTLDWTFCADELGNILGLLEWAAQENRWADVIALGRAIDPYLTLHGLWEAWRLVLNRILDAARSLGDRVSEGWVRHQLGTHAAGIGQTSQAIRFLRQAIDVRRALGDEVGVAFTQHNLDILLPPIIPIKPAGPPPPIGPGVIVLGSGAIVLIAFLLMTILPMIVQNGRAALAVTPTSTVYSAPKP